MITDKGSKQLYDKGNNLSGTYNITDAIENREFKNELEKKGGNQKEIFIRSVATMKVI